MLWSQDYYISTWFPTLRLVNSNWCKGNYRPFDSLVPKTLLSKHCNYEKKQLLNNGRKSATLRKWLCPIKIWEKCSYIRCPDAASQQVSLWCMEILMRSKLRTKNYNKTEPGPAHVKVGGSLERLLCLNFLTMIFHTSELYLHWLSSVCLNMTWR